MPATSLDVANEILNQLGGRRFAAFTGAKNFVGDASSLSFSLPGNRGFTKDGINVVKVTLTPMDVYTVEFCRVRRSGFEMKRTVIATVENVYNDNLREVFEEYTGLRTSL